MVVEVMNVYVALDLLAKAVREAREERGLSQRELARRLSMNTRTIMDLEICRSNPKGETIFLIARELHISLDAIAHAGTSRPNSVSADVLEFFSGKDDAESNLHFSKEIPSPIVPDPSQQDQIADNELDCRCDRQRCSTRTLNTQAQQA